MSVSVDWKPERAVQAKIRDMNKNDYPDRLKTRKGRSMQKLRIMTSNCISQHSPLGASSRQKNLRFEASADQRLGTGAFKVVREYNGYCVQCTFQYIYHFPNFSKIRGAMPLAGHHSIHQIWACAHLFGTLIYSICKISSIFDGNTWSKNFQNTKLFLHLLKSVNNKHTLFELVSSWSVHQHAPWERLHSERETWLRTMERTSAFARRSHIQKKIKKWKLAKLKTWKGGLGNRERPGGLKTRKGGPGKN